MPFVGVKEAEERSSSSSSSSCSSDGEHSETYEPEIDMLVDTERVVASQVRSLNEQRAMKAPRHRDNGVVNATTPRMNFVWHDLHLADARLIEASKVKDLWQGRHRRGTQRFSALLSVMFGIDAMACSLREHFDGNYLVAANSQWNECFAQEIDAAEVQSRDLLYLLTLALHNDTTSWMVLAIWMLLNCLSLRRFIAPPLFEQNEVYSVKTLQMFRTVVLCKMGTVTITENHRDAFKKRRKR